MAPEDTYSDEEAARRRDEALRRALSTPAMKPTAKPKRVKPIPGQRPDRAVVDE